MSSTNIHRKEAPQLEQRAWHARPLVVAMFGSLLLFAAQPPLGWSLLAWIAPLPWLSLATAKQLPGRRPGWQIWLASFLYWLVSLHWIRLAHPATIFGLVLLAGYLACYLVLFVSVVRTGVLKFRLPVWLVAPIAWVANEWLQAHLLSGFLMAALGHTQIDHPRLVQIADLGGAYSISGLIMLVAGCLWQIRHSWSAAVPGRLVHTAFAASVAVAAVVATNWYGSRRIAELGSTDDQPRCTIALIQGSERAVWTADPDRDKRVMDQYVDLSRQARDESQQTGRAIDLMVWPEGMFRTPMYSVDDSVIANQPDSPAIEWVEYAKDDLANLVQIIDAPLLVGLDRCHFVDDPSGARNIYNSAAAVRADGTLIGTYDKTHLVMFGEYVPGGTLWPALYGLFPIGGVTPGETPQAFKIGDVRYMPTICYETVMPHVVRRQVAELTSAGQTPEVLVNITNDSWFYDSSELRMHLACSRLRAIECRTPMVVAANGGLSANIDRCGKLLAVSQPLAKQVLLVDVAAGGRSTLYLQLGDTFAIGCLVVTLVVFAAGRFVSAPRHNVPPPLAG